MALYEKIRELAAQRGISIRKLEENLGFANATLRRWDTNKPSIDKIQAVARYFRVSVDYLLDEEEYMKDLSVDEILDSVEVYSRAKFNEADREIMRIIIEAKQMTNDK